jgi:hypothetical protein
MKRTVGILLVAVIAGSPGGLLAADDPPSARASEDQAVTWKTEHVDLRADAVALQIGDTLLSPGTGESKVQEWARDGDHVDLRVRWQQAGQSHELYLALASSGQRWAIADASYLQLGPGVRVPGAPSSPIRLTPVDITDGARPVSEGDPWQATARVPRYTCGTAADPADAADAALRIDGLDLAVAPPRHDLLDVVRSLLGRGSRSPGLWLGQDAYEGPPVTIACAPAFAVALEDEAVQLSPPYDPDAAPGWGLVTEEVAPGVHLVSSDGIRDLRSTPLPWCEGLASSLEFPDLDRRWGGVDDSTRGRVVAGLDGGIWLFWGDRFVRLGDETVHRWTDGQVPSARDDIEVAPDGTVWQAPAEGSGAARDRTDDERVDRTRELLRANPGAVAARPDCLTDTSWLTWPDGALRAYRDGRWEVALDAPLGGISQVEIGSDESVWTANGGSHSQSSGPFVARLGSDGWRLATSPDGRVDPAYRLAALQDGSVVFQARRRPVALWRLDEGLGSWQPQESASGLSDMVASPTGIIWGKSAPNAIARLDEGGWQHWDLGQATDPQAPRFIGGGGPLAVGQDGSLWLKARPARAVRGCHGIYRFDGTTWSHFLEGQCVHSIDVAPNGWAWLRAAPDLGQGEGPVDLYAIGPDAPGD